MSYQKLVVIACTTLLLSPYVTAWTPNFFAKGQRCSRAMVRTVGTTESRADGISLDPRRLIKDGMDSFRRGDVIASVAAFDRALGVDERYSRLLWQRGLSLYYAGEYAAGAEQFRRDVSLNPNDTEEAIWAFLCEARMPEYGFEEARRRIIKVEKDPRPYMRVAYDLFSGKASEEDLAKVGHESGEGSAADFYAKLYLGLLNEAAGDVSKAQSYMVSAAMSTYGPRTNDYMWDLARVHMKQRRWH